MALHRILILGGTGFVGRHLTAALAGAGHGVRILSRDPEGHRELRVLPGVELRPGDAHDPDTLRRALSGCNTAVNLVGILNERRRGRDFRAAHVELPRKLVEACAANGVRRLLHMSALNADAARGSSAYLRTKGEGEDLVHLAAGQGLRVTSFRPSVVFGADDSFINRFAGLLRLAPGVLPLACPEARFAPVYVGDVVEAFRRSLDLRPAFGARYELCGPRAYTLREIVEWIARVLGLRRRVLGLGDRLSRLQARLLDHAPGRPFTYDNYLSLRTDSVCREPALRKLGVEPTALEAIMPHLLERARSNPLDRYRRR